MIENGDVVVATGEHGMKTYFKYSYERYGYEPFRISKKPAKAYPSLAGIVIPKYSPLKQMFDPVVLSLRQAGIIDQYTRSYYYYWRPESIEDKPKPLNIMHLLIPIGLLVSGLFLSLLIFTIKESKIFYAYQWSKTKSSVRFMLEN